MYVIIICIKYMFARHHMHRILDTFVDKWELDFQQQYHHGLITRQTNN